MSFKTILVSLTNEKNAKRLVQTACAVARKFDAHLIGLHTIPALEIYPDIMSHVPEDVAKSLDQSQMQEAAKIEEIFRTVTAPETLVSEWRCMRSYTPNISDRINEQARCADLVILAQPDKENDRTDQRQIQRDVIANCGRPVLVIPKTGDYETIGKNILVGWSATQEATRAVHDAIPFAKMADMTTIFWVAKHNKATYMADTGHEMAKCLDRHDIRAQVSHRVQSDLPIGDELLNEAADSGADLIVIGAFGHSTVYDFMVGATTPHLMKHMNVPVLFSC